MNKITYSSLKLKIKDEISKIDGTDIEVKQYLPIEDKNALINITLQNAKENGIFNPLLVDAYFHLYLTILYTNINFTEKQKEEPMKLYDVLKSNGIIDKVIMHMNEDEYNNLLNYINQEIETLHSYKNTIGSVIRDIIDNLPIKAEEMQKIVDTFDPEKFQNVLNFAKAANGNRDI